MWTQFRVNVIYIKKHKKNRTADYTDTGFRNSNVGIVRFELIPKYFPFVGRLQNDVPYKGGVGC